MPRLISSHVRSFGRFIEPFTLILEHRGLVLIEGENHDRGDAYNSNAAGKSMMVEAVKWCLTNKLARSGDDQVAGDDVCWDGHPADVETIFENPRGMFKAHRRRTPTGRPTLKVEVLGADYEAWVPLQESGIHADLASDDLTKLLGFDDRALRNAILLQGSGLDMGGSTFKNQMQVLESVLRFDDFTRAAKYANDRAKVLDVEARETIMDIDRWSGQREQARNVLTELEALDESAREVVLIDEIRAQKTLMRSLLASEDTLTAHRRTSLELFQAHADARARLKHAQELHVSRERLGDQCDVCLAALNGAMRKTLLTRSAEGVESYVCAEKVRHDAFDAFAPQLIQAEADYETFRAAVLAKKNADRELLDIRTRAAARMTMIQTQQGKIDDAEQKLADLTDRVATTRRTLHVAQAWSKTGFAELKVEILGAAAPVLNQASDRFSTLLSDGYPRVEFNTARDSRSENLLRIRDETGVRPYKSFSGGERARIDLIVALTLRECARWRMQESVNLCVFDECFDSLDDSGMSRALEVIHRDLDELESVFIITHSAKLREIFPSAHVIRVIRRGGISRVIDE